MANVCRRFVLGLALALQGLPVPVSADDAWPGQERQECALGSYYTLTETCKPCVGGQVRRRRATDCTPCPPATYQIEGTDLCYPCWYGMTTRRRSTFCEPCPSMKYTPKGSLDKDCTSVWGQNGTTTGDPVLVHDRGQVSTTSTTTKFAGLQGISINSDNFFGEAAGNSTTTTKVAAASSTGSGALGSPLSTGSDVYEELLGVTQQLLRKNTLVLSDFRTSQEFTLSFDLQPLGIVSTPSGTGWTSILHFAGSTQDCCRPYDRIPAFFFLSGSLEMYIRMDRVDAGDDGVTPQPTLTSNVWSNIAVQLKGNEFALFLNGVKYASNTRFSAKVEGKSGVKVYASSPWHEAASAHIRNIKYFRGASRSEEFTIDDYLSLMALEEKTEDGVHIE